MAANPLGYPPKPAFFLDTQIREGYLSEKYRREGNSSFNANDPVIAAEIAARTQPVGGLAPFQVAPPPRSAAGRAMLARTIENRGRQGYVPLVFWVGYQPPAPPFIERTFSQMAINHPISRAQMARNNISFVKQLGWDKEGTTTLWHVSNWNYFNPAGTHSNLVCKVMLDPASPFFALEGAWNQALARSPHIVHYASVWQETAPHASAQVGQDSLNLDADPLFAFTKYARHGDLQSWIARLLDQTETFPKSILWRLFDCLADACIAMAYPPRRQTNPWQNLRGPDLPEDIPGVPVQGGYFNIIHLQFDLSSIFVEDYDNNNHSDIPRLQVGSFARAVDPSNWNFPVFMPLNTWGNFNHLDMFWTTRGEGRDGWWLPEQVSAEWDHVNYEPFSEGFTDNATGIGAAGAWTEKSNIFHMGQIIYCCMLKQQPERPPRATPVPASGANQGAQGWTYVGEMKSREFHGTFGRNLCHLVRDCCKHNPADRPDLATLKNTIAAGMAANPVDDNDRNWVRRTLHDPGDPPQVVPEPPTAAPGAVIVLPF